MMFHFKYSKISEGFSAKNKDKVPKPILKTRIAYSWRWELASIALTFGTNCCIVALLYKFDGQTVPAWPFGININTMISIISNISQASIVIVVAEAMGQTKWHWFRSARPLSHFTVFDSASSGWIGSIKLLGLAPTSLLALLGIVTSTTALAIGPFTQQANRFVGCLEPSSNGTASLPVTSSPASDYLYFERTIRVGNAKSSPGLDLATIFRRPCFKGLAFQNEIIYRTWRNARVATVLLALRMALHIRLWDPAAPASIQQIWFLSSTTRPITNTAE